MHPSIKTVTRTRDNTYTQANPVIRNTYLLLSLTLLFSACTAWYSAVTQAPPLGTGVVLVGYMGLLFLTQALSKSAWGLGSIFLLTGFLGYTLGPILQFTLSQFQNGPQLIMASLGLTGSIFLTLSLYALNTRKDFSYLTGFLLVSSTLAFLLSLLAIFFHWPVLDLAVTGAFVLISSGLILLETSRIIQGGERNYIMATISLYVSIYNLFLSLLRILMVLAGRRDE